MFGLKELRGQKTFEELELEMQGIKYTTSTIEILKSTKGLKLIKKGKNN